MFFKTSAIFKQYVIVIVANFATFQLIMCLTWLSPVIVQLTDKNQTVLSEPMTEVQLSWLVSISSVADVVAMIFTGYLADNLGRKKCMLIAFVPRLFACLLFIFGNQVWMLLVARALCGLCDAFMIVVVAAYTSEIASKEIRGGLGTISQICSSLGSMVIYAVGPYVTYNTLNIVLTSIIICTSIPFLFLPESPYFLYSKDRKEEALKVLTYLRNDETAALDEIKQFSLNKEEKINIKQILKDKIVLKTIFIVIFISFLSQMAGFTTITVFLQTIFEMTNTSLSTEICSVIFGCIAVFSCTCTIYFSDRFGRKPVLCLSLIGCTAGMIALGAFFYLTQNGKAVGFMNYLPLISLVVVIYSYNAGIGSLQWILYAELFEGPARAVGISSGLATACVTAFFSLRYMTTLINVIGSANTFWMFGGFNLLLCLFIIFIVPETKGKTFSEIQKDLGKCESKEDNIFEQVDKPNVIWTVDRVECGNKGLGSLQWILYAELFEGPTRAFGVSSGLATSATAGFFSLRYMTTLINVIGSANTFWMFGGFDLLLCLFIFFIVPETKGKTFSEIQKDLGKESKEDIFAHVEPNVIWTVDCVDKN